MEIRLAPNGTHFILQMKDEMGIEVPISESGANIIASILRARRMAPRPKIGTPAFPLQSVIDAWVLEDGKRKRDEARAMLDAQLVELDIDLDL